jgi:hypothetical protein
MTAAGPLLIGGLIALTLVTSAACLLNSGRFLAPARFPPARWRKLPALTAILLVATLLLWFTGFSS